MAFGGLVFDWENHVIVAMPRGRPIHVEGETPRPDIPEWRDALLAGVGRLLRRYHDAAAGFVPPSDAAWPSPAR